MTLSVKFECSKLTVRRISGFPVKSQVKSSNFSIMFERINLVTLVSNSIIRKAFGGKFECVFN